MTASEQKKPRQTNIEILRIVAMMLIVVSHYIGHGLRGTPSFIHYDIASSDGALNYATLQLLSVFATTGVNCFVLITGYFLIDNVKLRGGIFKLWLQTAFYSLAFATIFTFAMGRSLSVGEWIDSLSPMPADRYWFVSKYMALMLVAPFLAKLASNLNARQHLYMLVVMLLLFFNYPFGDMFATWDSLSWFVFLFFLGGYIRKYGVHPWLYRHAVALCFASALCFFAVHATTNTLTYLHTDSPGFTIKSTGNNDFTFIVSFFLFVSFTKFKLQGNFWRRLSRLAPYTFGIYLCHEHPLIRPVIWSNVLPEEYHVPMIVHCLCVSIALFLVCAAIDYVREWLFRVLRVDSMVKSLSARLPQPFKGS